MAVVYHWRHGWIPLDHVAALSKAKGNHEAAAKMLSDVHGANGIQSRQHVAHAVRDLPSLHHEADRRDAMTQIQHGALAHNSTDLLPGHAAGPSNAEKITNAETMFGTGSKQHRQALARFGPDSNPNQRDPGATSRPDVPSAGEMQRAQAKADRTTADTMSKISDENLQANIGKYRRNAPDSPTLKILEAEARRRGLSTQGSASEAQRYAQGLSVQELRAALGRQLTNPVRAAVEAELRKRGK